MRPSRPDAARTTREYDPPRAPLKRPLPYQPDEARDTRDRDHAEAAGTDRGRGFCQLRWRDTASG